jgi:uncharacterized phiE125 gp8 family phage protein
MAMRYAMVLVTPPSGPAVTLAEAKASLRNLSNDEDELIEGLIAAAQSHLERLLGIVMVSSTWSWNADAFDTEMELPVTTTEIASVIWSDAAGLPTTIVDTDYSLMTDGVGNSSIRFLSTFAEPTGLGEFGAVQVTFTAGVEPKDVDPALKQAIKLLVGHWFNHREAVGEGGFEELPLSVRALITPFWRPSV